MRDLKNATDGGINSHGVDQIAYEDEAVCSRILVDVVENAAVVAPRADKTRYAFDESSA